MEIFIKSQNNQERVHWLNSLPKPYLDKIASDFTEHGIELDHSGQYKVIFNVNQLQPDSIKHYMPGAKRQANVQQNPRTTTVQQASNGSRLLFQLISQFQEQGLPSSPQPSGIDLENSQKDLSSNPKMGDDRKASPLYLLNKSAKFERRASSQNRNIIEMQERVPGLNSPGFHNIRDFQDADFNQIDFDNLQQQQNLSGEQKTPFTLKKMTQISHQQHPSRLFTRPISHNAQLQKNSIVVSNANTKAERRQKQLSSSAYAQKVNKQNVPTDDTSMLKKVINNLKTIQGKRSYTSHFIGQVPQGHSLKSTIEAISPKEKTVKYSETGKPPLNDTSKKNLLAKKDETVASNSLKPSEQVSTNRKQLAVNAEKETSEPSKEREVILKKSAVDVFQEELKAPVSQSSVEQATIPVENNLDSRFANEKQYPGLNLNANLSRGQQKGKQNNFDIKNLDEKSAHQRQMMNYTNQQLVVAEKPLQVHQYVRPVHGLKATQNLNRKNKKACQSPSAGGLGPGQAQPTPTAKSAAIIDKMAQVTQGGQDQTADNMLDMRLQSYNQAQQEEHLNFIRRTNRPQLRGAMLKAQSSMAHLVPEPAGRNSASGLYFPDKDLKENHIHGSSFLREGSHLRKLRSVVAKGKAQYGSPQKDQFRPQSQLVFENPDLQENQTSNQHQHRKIIPHGLSGKVQKTMQIQKNHALHKPIINSQKLLSQSFKKKQRYNQSPEQNQQPRSEFSKSLSSPQHPKHRIASTTQLLQQKVQSQVQPPPTDFTQSNESVVITTQQNAQKISTDPQEEPYLHFLKFKAQRVEQIKQEQDMVKTQQKIERILQKRTTQKSVNQLEESQWKKEPVQADQQLNTSY